MRNIQVGSSSNLSSLISPSHLLLERVSLQRVSEAVNVSGFDYGTVEKDVEEHHH